MNKQNQWLFEVAPSLEVNESNFEASDGEWEVAIKSKPTGSRTSNPIQRIQAPPRVAQSIPRPMDVRSPALGQPSQSPLALGRVLTYDDVRSDRIDVFAQKALLRMSKNPSMSADAAKMAAAVKSGKLGGIYKEDQKVPALRIKKINPKAWWVHIIPKGEDAVLFLDPDNPIRGVPIIVFRDPVRSVATKLDAALQKAWQTYVGRENGRLVTCPNQPSSLSPEKLGEASWRLWESPPSPSPVKPVPNCVPPILCKILGKLTLNGTTYPIFPGSATPICTTKSFDAALDFATSSTQHTFIIGDMMTSGPFKVFNWIPTAPLPNPLPVVGRFEPVEPISAVVLGGETGYFPSDPTIPKVTQRWVTIPRLRDFYRLPEQDQTAHRSRWLKAINPVKDKIIWWLEGTDPAKSKITAIEAVKKPEDLPMPALRLLLANFASFAIPLPPGPPIGEPAAVCGVGTLGVTVPILRYPPTSELEYYLAVTAEVEGKLEAINAWDAGAGISIGPIQLNAQRAALFKFLWELWKRDQDLFQQEFGQPLGWSMELQNNYPVLKIKANKPKDKDIVLHGREDKLNLRRNINYFQSGSPVKSGYNVKFRRRVAEQFRNVTVWPHVQEIVIEVSVWWLEAGLDDIRRSGIPAVDIRNPDRDTFILKAILLSAYVRYSGCLEPILNAMKKWKTPSEKLRYWRNALSSTRETCQKLRARLGPQEKAAQQVHNAILRRSCIPDSKIPLCKDTYQPRECVSTFENQSLY